MFILLQSFVTSARIARRCYPSPRRAPAWPPPVRSWQHAPAARCLLVDAQRPAVSMSTRRHTAAPAERWCSRPLGGGASFFAAAAAAFVSACCVFEPLLAAAAAPAADAAPAAGAAAVFLVLVLILVLVLRPIVYRSRSSLLLMAVRPTDFFSCEGFRSKGPGVA